MFKQRYIIEVKGSNDRVYRFECESSATLGEMYDALYTMKAAVLKQLQTSHEKEAKDSEGCSEKCEEECKEEDKNEAKS